MDQERWDQFVIKHGPRSGSFLQSWGWGEFQRAMGRGVKKIEIGNWRSGQGMIAHAISQDVSRAMRYWYIPRGPIGTKDTLRDFLSKLNEGPFWRLDLPVPSGFSFFQFPNIFFAPHYVQPPDTILLDLTQSEEQLLQQMHEKTRYNIRLGERHGLEVSQGDPDEFLTLLRETSRRDRFRTHPEAYYRIMLARPDDSNFKISLVVARRRDGRAVAAAIVCDFGLTRTYLHGASSYPDRALMAPYVLHWRLIQEAKAKGFLTYDFWGVVKGDNPADRLAGVTRFKKGWGGEVVSYLPTLDLVLKPWQYRVYRCLAWLKSMML